MLAGNGDRLVDNHFARQYNPEDSSEHCTISCYFFSIFLKVYLRFAFENYIDICKVHFERCLKYMPLVKRAVSKQSSSWPNCVVINSFVGNITSLHQLLAVNSGLYSWQVYGFFFSGDLCQLIKVSA
jgi:hypothetical protein